MVVAFSCLALILLHVLVNVSSDNDDGPPSSLIVRGQRDLYQPVPHSHRRKFYIKGKGATTVTRAFRNRGWQLVHSIEESQIYYRSRGGGDTRYYAIGKPWQRYSRVPGISKMESKDGFLAGFRSYQKNRSDVSLYFLPETYRMKEEIDVTAFRRLLKEGGDQIPWVKKNVSVNNGRGIEMLGPRSTALYTAVDRCLEDSANTYIIQKYVCNELTWFHNEKFDVRFYWLVASVDPVIVLFHDGCARVGGAGYDETDFGNTTQHLTNHAFRAEDQSEVTPEFLWRRIREHYANNKRRLSRQLRIRDPVKHVRNQMKESIGALVAAFRDVSFGADPHNVTVENLFGWYGADFIIDADLDVYFVEMQASPGFGESYDYRVDMFRSLFRPMVDVVEEIQLKQERDATANILPLKTLAGWEIVYAGDWQYQYKGYKRPKDKKSCEIKQTM